MSDRRDLRHLRQWLQYWQLRTWILDNLCYLTIKSDTGQHSQFLRCFSNDTKVSAENSTVVPCIFTNVTYCDPAPGAVDKIGRFLSSTSQSLFSIISVSFFSLFRIISVFTLLFRLFDIPVGLRASSSGQFLRRSVLQEESYTVATIISVVVSIFMSAITFTDHPMITAIIKIASTPLPSSSSPDHPKSWWPPPSQGDLVSIDPSEFGTPTWALTLCLLAAWIIIFLCLVKVLAFKHLIFLTFLISRESSRVARLSTSRPPSPMSSSSSSSSGSSSFFFKRFDFPDQFLLWKKGSVGFEKQIKPNDKLYVFFIYQGSHSSWGVPWHQLLFGKITAISRIPHTPESSIVFGIWGCVFVILVCVCVLYVGVCIWYLRVVIFSECLCLGSLCLEYTAQYMLWIKFS